MEYALIRADSSVDLNDLVNDYLKRGWKLYGFPFSNSRGDARQYISYCQAVVKDPTPKPQYHPGMQDL